MKLQKACEILENLTEKECTTNFPKLSLSEFLALQMVLLEMQGNGSYKLSDKLKVKEG